MIKRIIGKIIKFSSNKTIKVLTKIKKYSKIYKRKFFIKKNKLVNFEGSILKIGDNILLEHKKNSKKKNLSYLKKI
ncbi:30S ribosomal protein S17 [Candidatus Vidania fulgoroideorum]